MKAITIDRLTNVIGLVGVISGVMALSKDAPEYWGLIHLAAFGVVSWYTGKGLPTMAQLQQMQRDR